MEKQGDIVEAQFTPDCAYVLRARASGFPTMKYYVDSIHLHKMKIAIVTEQTYFED